MEINDRIKYLRKDVFHLTQEDLGRYLGLTRANIANIESGRISVTDRVIVTLEKEFGINTDWLRYGSGEPILPKSRNQTIADFMADLISEKDTTRSRLIEALAKLDADDWEDIERIGRKIFGTQTES